MTNQQMALAAIRDMKVDETTDLAQLVALMQAVASIALKVEG